MPPGPPGQIEWAAFHLFDCGVGTAALSVGRCVPHSGVWGKGFPLEGVTDTMADNQDSLIREVDEELRREQLTKLWEQYGTYFLGAAAAIVVGVAGFKWYEQRQLQAAQAAGARFEAATNLVADGKLDDATRAFADIAKDGPAGYATLARLRAAGGLVTAGKTAEAVAAYEALGVSTTSDPLLRDFARLQAASLRAGQADWTEMQNRLNDLAAEKAPWRHLASELLGVAALKAGKPSEARKALEPLVADPGVPAGLAERARLFMSQVVAAEQAVAPAGAPANPSPMPTDAKK